MQFDADVIIVGAGMVGATLANALADSPLRVLLVDALDLQQRLPVQPGASGYEPRVSAFSAASERILQRLGVWQRLPPERLCGYRHMRVWDAEGTGAIAFDAEALGELRLGHIIENTPVQQALLDALQQTPVRVQGQRRTRVLVKEDAGWRLEFEQGEALRTPLLVAADGAQSRVRDLAGFEMREWDYLHHALVTTVQVEQPHADTAWQRFLPSGPLAFLPLPSRDGRHYCSIVWSLLAEPAEAMMALDDQAFAAALSEAIEQRLGRVLAVDRRYRIPLRQRHAKRYVMPGLALVGDAAHSIHPLAGQGVNLGMLDAACLAEVLMQAQSRGESCAELQVLERYQRQRIGHNLGMMAAMEGFERLFHAEALPLRWLRNAGMNWMDGHGVLKAAIIRRAMGLEGDLPALARGSLTV
ncbi:MAG: FAD-dependent monooxygenase [Halopseudomonas yangmingensis]|uniref:2-octaprenylphenol hydroxylase n=1 Tax=Halopseudomonas yangmingensis TaxID=1720063 RepID=A0A1I4TGY4_9GAMM|nr:FAD-dependent monooxygenase [Halopseudomonas yangmingensis]SFM75974.1 2-octaprenylphenol hydroxylase [Halopseudomonas yangmingensis]